LRRANAACSRHESLDADPERADRPQGDSKDDHQVHSRHGEQMREPARAEISVVLRREISLAKNERPGHWRQRRIERGVDAAPDEGTSAVDGWKDAPRSFDDPNVDGASRSDHAAPRQPRTGITFGLVPEALGGRQVGQDVNDVATRQVGRSP